MASKWLHDTSSRCFVSPLNVIAAAPHSTSGCVHCSIASTQLRSPPGHLDPRAAISHDRHPDGNTGSPLEGGLWTLRLRISANQTDRR